MNDTLHKLTNPERTLKHADMGDVTSMYVLGKHHLYIATQENDNRHVESLQALYWLSKAAQKGLWKAYYWLAATISFFRSSMGFGGEKYFLRYRDKEIHSNPVYKDIITRLERDGYNKDSKPNNWQESYDKINTAYMFFYNFNHLYYNYYPTRCDDIISCFVKIAAKHGHVQAQAWLGELYQRAWNDWCDYLLTIAPDKSYARFQESGLTIMDIKGFYSLAKHWFYKADSAGENVDSDLKDLLESEKNLNKLDEYVNEFEKIADKEFRHRLMEEYRNSPPLPLNEDTTTGALQIIEEHLREIRRLRPDKNTGNK